MDLTQKILEEDYQLSDIKDRNKEGDVAFKAPVETTATREAEQKAQKEIQELADQLKREQHPAMDPGMQKAVDGFWGGGSSAAAPNQAMMQTLLASAKTGPAAGAYNPVDSMRRAKEIGALPTGFKIIGRENFANPARKV